VKRGFLVQSYCVDKFLLVTSWADCLSSSKLIVVAFFGLLVAAGCGDSRRQSIEGTVTLDGAPLTEGQIRFAPLPGTSGPTTGSPITDGKFTIPQEGGSFAGKFRVEITARRMSNKKMMDPESGKMVNVFEQYIPPRYNRQSELTADIEAGADNRFDFAVTSR